ncbi:LuxR C-terminal-related transcriptional regulator [Streptomyces reniochalinae]|uniref:HTH luxR-type domain-containing protein n=1 Tax=Streptomyces reniochalinae TaxID=2250578 RepID=A0A367EXI5_9ACTN|nr:hypothetical protein DQ392_06660 [Streptomyces reniochalinae]
MVSANGICHAQVVRPVALGRANRDIAESLVLSTRSVENHVARIVRKLGVSSRKRRRRSGSRRKRGRMVE